MAVNFTAILFLLLRLGCAMATIMDFSKETWPVMSLRVANLEPERKELDYGGHTIPKSHGLIELECMVVQSSLPSSLGLEMAGKVTGVKWILPNPGIIDEGRAYIKYEGGEPKLSTNLVITEFHKEEDMGDYTCQMTLEDESITRYKETIHIPALDGSPIISCRLTCERNMDENCQLAGTFDLVCKTYAFHQISTHCKFHPCVTEEKCPPPMINPILGGWMPPPFLSRPTPMYKYENKLQKGGLAGASGRFDCQSHNRRKTSLVSIYASVSVAPTKPRGIRLTVPAIGPDGEPIDEVPPTPKFLASVYPEFLTNLNHVELGCWTSHNVGNFEWRHRPIDSSEETILDDQIAAERGITIYQEQMYGGRGTLLNIEKYDMEKGGYYKCKAIDKNDYSAHSKEFTLPSTKWGPHTDMASGKTITATVNSSVTIRCDMLSTTSGNYFNWQKAHLTDAAIANLSPSDKYEFSNDSQTLTVHNLTSDDAGKYGCHKWGGGADGKDFEGEVTVLVSDSPPDFHEKLEMLADVLRSLDEAGHQLFDVVNSMNAATSSHHHHFEHVRSHHVHDHGQDHHDHGQDHAHDHQDHGHDHQDHGHDHQDHGHDHQDHAHDHQDHGHDHQDHAHDHQDHGHDHQDHGHDHQDHGQDHHHDHVHDHHDHGQDHHHHHDHGQDHQDHGQAEVEHDSSEEVD